MFYTIDAILATALFLALLTTAFLQLSALGSPTFDESQLSTIAFDTLAVLEKNNTLNDAVNEDSTTQLSLLLSTLPSNVCASLSVYNSTGLVDSNLTRIGAVSRPGCMNVTTTLVAIHRRTFHPAGKPTHVAEVAIWYR